MFKNKIFLLLIVAASTSLFFFNFRTYDSNLKSDYYKKVLARVYIEAKTQRIDPNIIETYLNEMQTVCTSDNNKIERLDYVFVLSGRGTYLKKVSDVPNFKEDIEDGHNRMELAIQIARKITVLNSGKSNITQKDMEEYGPIIIYNGAPMQNEDLQKALKEGLLSNYPKTKFLILALDPKDINTRGQFRSLKEKRLPKNISVGIVTHAYHCPRVARLINSKWYPFSENTQIFFYLVDQQPKAPAVEKEMIGEMRRIPHYINLGDLGQEMAKEAKFNIFQ